MPRQDIYTQVTDTIIAALEGGVIPWRKPWSQGGAPQNFVSRRPYRGMNAFLLSMRPNTTPFWLTYRQAQELGGYVRKGEQGTPIIFWSVLERAVERDDEATTERYGYLKTWKIFNLDQCEGIASPAAEPRAFTPIEAAEQVVAGMPQRPGITNDGGNRAYYRPLYDSVHLPKPTLFNSPEEYYCTLFHELAHSTGHVSRLARPDLMAFDLFGGHAYSREEMVAEMTAAMLCGVTGIAPAVVENSAAYIGGWLRRLSHDKKLLIQAAALAQKAADFILAFPPQAITTEAGETSMDTVAGEA